MKRIAIKDLNGDTIDAKPRYADWSEGYPEHWEFWEANKCDKCGKALVGINDDTHCNIDPESDCDGRVPRSEGPMMNYIYPLPEQWRDYTHSPNSEIDAALLIADLPLCIVLKDNEWGLALTGGGTDLSWEICEAFMRLGYMPPMHFRLPRMAGMDLGSPRNRWIIAGCRKSAQVMIKRARWAIRDLMKLKPEVTA